MSDGLVIFDVDGQITYTNEKFSSMLNIPRDQLLEFSLSELVEDSSKEQVGALVLGKSGKLGRHEISFRKMDGTSLKTVTSISQLRDSKGRYRQCSALITDITPHILSEEQLKRSLKDKVILLREIHHRVKNNLQVISSILSLQAMYLEDDTYISVFNECQNRIRSMSLIHEKLYQSENISNIDFKDYLISLVNRLMRFYRYDQASVGFHESIPEIDLNIDIAIPCGLIINELVSNSLKYAFQEKHVGTISISLIELDDSNIELIVADDGIGIPSKIDIKNSPTLGLQLVTTLIEDQLQGTFKVNNTNGTEFQIRFNGVKK